MGFTHLHVHSNFSFLDGGSSIRALLDRAKEIGCESLALTDHNGLYGAVRFYDYALKVGVKPIVGVEMDVEGSGEWRAESGEKGGRGSRRALAAGTLDGGDSMAQCDQSFPQQSPKADSSTSLGMTGRGALMVRHIHVPDQDSRASTRMGAQPSPAGTWICPPIKGTWICPPIKMTGNSHLVLLAKNLNGYSNLCKIITRAQLSHEKGEAAASLSVIEQYKDDLFCLSGCAKGEIASRVARGDIVGAKAAAARLMEIFGREHFLIEMQNNMLPGTALVNYHLNEIASELGLRCVATNNVHYAAKDDFKVQDLLVCVRTITKLDERHPLRKLNSEYYLKTPRAMANLFRKYPKAVAAADWVARQCNLDLKLGTYRFPDFPVPDGETPYSYLCKLCFEALGRLYRPITPRVTERLQHELSVIDYLGFAEYFLVVWDIVRHARSKGIRCSGRGSAADSIVSYCLGISIVDPIEHNLLFERFLNPERKGMPDIDIDFDAARRDEVIEYIYNRYGEDKVAMVCTVSTLRAKSSIRDLGKAMDFSPADISRVASALPHTGGKRIREAIDKLPELRDANLPMSRLEALIEVCEKVDDFPRHLSVHLGGMVISKGLLTELVPLEWATKGVIVSQFDKDDIETLGLVKMDILGLRNLSAIEDSLAYIREGLGIDLDIDNIPLDDEPTYQLLRSMNTVGCFQVESPGMRGLLGRLQPKVFEDITAQVSLFRPGPMQADMINPFIARRHGEEKVTYPHPSMEPVLKETYGVILYQEQVISVAHALAGFTYGQADSFRRAMTHDRGQVEMEKIHEEFVESARRRGVDAKIAEHVFGGLRAFAAYGFCKAHAASFARICYQTAYLKVHYPAQFMAGILNNEPMGFYPPNVIIEEARHSGVRILGLDVNRSGRKFGVEFEGSGKWKVESGEKGRDLCCGNDCAHLPSESPRSRVPATCGSAGVSPSLPQPPTPIPQPLSPGIRIALSRVKNISEAQIDSILAAREERPFSSFSDFCLRTRCDRPTIENLINCGAFDSFGIQRGKLMWLLGEVISGKRKVESGKRGGRGSRRAEAAGTLDGADTRGQCVQPFPQQSQKADSSTSLGMTDAGVCLGMTDARVCLGMTDAGVCLGMTDAGACDVSAFQCRNDQVDVSAFQCRNDQVLFDDLSVTDLDEQIALLPDVPEPTLHEKVRMDYEVLGLTPLCHPMVFYREKLAKARVLGSSDLAGLPNNTIVKLAGVVVVCMRPPTKSGAVVVFITLEDEDGLADCVVFPKIYEQYGKVIFNNPALIIEGKLQKMGQGISIIVRKVKPLANTYRTDDSVEIKPFTERRRIAGARSFVRSAGV